MRIPRSKSIEAFIHCVKCIQEMPDNMSPKEWAMLEIGWTVLGIQIWCIRHDVNVMHMDFEGHKHPATTSTKTGIGSISW